MAAKVLISRFEKIEKRLERIEKKLRTQAEQRKMDLKEKFRLHDRAQTLLRKFEKGWLDDLVIRAAAGGGDSRYAEVTEIVKDLAKLVDVALGVKFP